MFEDLTQYEAYLLRMWRADNGGHSVWRFSLETRQHREVFSSLEELLAFLKAEVADEPLETDE